MKTIEVAAAIIIRGGRALATQRGYGELKGGGWEFPGGKLEPGEGAKDAVVREIMEELRVDIEVDSHLITVDHDYDTFHLVMHCFLCTMADEQLVLTEHEAACWLDASSIDSVSWLPADLEVVRALKQACVLN